MPRWMLYCSLCRRVFPHSEVTFDSSVANPFGWLGNKPNFPDGGLSLKCPNCMEAALYQRYQLFYQHEAV